MPSVLSRILVSAGVILVLSAACMKDARGFWSRTPFGADSHITGSDGADSVEVCDLNQAQGRLALLEKQLSRDVGFRWELLAELARLCFIVGELEDRSERGRYYEKGKSYSERLCHQEPNRVEGHYWLGLNTAGMAEVGGARRALGLIPAIIHELQTAIAIDETYDRAGPHRILGRIYCKAPCWPLSEGDIGKSLHHLDLAVKLAPENSTNHLYRAETLVQMGRSEEARGELAQVLGPTCRAVFPHSVDEDHQDAILLMKECK